jgi:hypothetical protein
MLTTFSAAAGALCIWSGCGLALMYAHFLADHSPRTRAY